MVISLKENGLTIRLAGSEFIFIEMGQFIKAIGSKICKMDREWSLGQMEASTKGNTKTVRSMAKGCTYGLTAAITQGHGSRTKYMDTASTFGSMGGSM